VTRNDPEVRPAGADGAPGGPSDDGHQTISAAQASRLVGVTAPTLRRWAREGLIPQYAGRWTPPVVAHARIVARLRDRGHTIEHIRTASRAGRLAFGYVEDLFPSVEEDGQTVTLRQAAAEVGLEPALVERVYQSLGLPAPLLDRLSERDLRMLRNLAAVLDAGFPLVALLQIVRVYGQALAQIADAEVRLFHLYVHEPLMRDGVPSLRIAEDMEGLARELLPLAAPLMDGIHRRYLAHFVEQDVVGHMEASLEASDLDLGRLRVVVGFADLAGYTRLTEEQGEEEAVGAVERFVERVESTLPDDARVIKTIGDEVMIVGADTAALARWAVGFQAAVTERPLPRIGLHAGETIYRDGDYYGRAVNLAARVAARSAGGEVLVTRPVVDAGAGDLEFERIAQVRLKGFSDPTELFLARPAGDDGGEVS
jgi:adenylate cyclase